MIRDLGIKIEESLSATPQVNALCQTLSFHLKQIYSLKKFLSDSSLRTVISAKFTSRLDYCNSMLYGVPAYDISRLQRLQNSAARLIYSVDRRQHITPVLKELHWLPVEARVKFKVAVLVCKAINRRSPAYIKELIKIYQPNRALRSASNGILLSPPSSRTKIYGERRFSAAAPKVWNALPVHVRCAEDFRSFKSRLKTFFFVNYYGSS